MRNEGEVVYTLYEEPSQQRTITKVAGLGYFDSVFRTKIPKRGMMTITSHGLRLLGDGKILKAPVKLAIRVFGLPLSHKERKATASKTKCF